MSNKEIDLHRLSTEMEPSETQRKLVQESLGFEGIKRMLDRRYERDPKIGMDPQQGIDCSGLVSLALDNIRYQRKNGSGDVRYCPEYFRFFGYSVVPEYRQAGDLVFFSLYGEDRPNHMGIMVSYEEYIHTDREQGKVVITQLEFKKILVRHEPAQYSINPIGFRRLFPLSKTEE